MIYPAPPEQNLLKAVLKFADPSQRAAYLQQTCGDDEALRHCVEDLHKDYDQAWQFLQKPRAEASAETVVGTSGMVQ